MRRALLMVFWGLVMVAVDIKLDEVDWLLPDIVGYALIFIALTALAGVNRQFAKARPFVVLGALLWGIALFREVPQPLVAFAGMAVELAMMWFICTGILQLALERSNLDLARSAETRRNGMVGVTLVGFTLLALNALVPPFAPIVIVPVAIASLTATALVLFLVRRASMEID